MFYRCIDAPCPKHNKTEYATQNAFIGHLYTKTYERLVQLCQVYNLCNNPKSESRRTLMHLIEKASRIRQQGGFFA